MCSQIKHVLDVSVMRSVGWSLGGVTTGKQCAWSGHSWAEHFLQEMTFQLRPKRGAKELLVSLSYQTPVFPKLEKSKFFVYPLCPSSVTQLCPPLCNPMDCSTPGFSVHHQHPKLAQIHVHWVGDVIQPSHPLSSPSPLAFNLSQHQGSFQWVSSLHPVAKVLECQHQSFQ